MIATCRLRHVDPYTYLVDVLQRVGSHPEADVARLTPRLWKQHFAAPCVPISVNSNHLWVYTNFRENILLGIITESDTKTI